MSKSNLHFRFMNIKFDDSVNTFISVQSNSLIQVFLSEIPLNKQLHVKGKGKILSKIEHILKTKCMMTINN